MRRMARAFRPDYLVERPSASSLAWVPIEQTYDGVVTCNPRQLGVITKPSDKSPRDRRGPKHKSTDFRSPYPEFCKKREPIIRALLEQGPETEEDAQLLCEYHTHQLIEIHARRYIEWAGAAPETAWKKAEDFLRRQNMLPKPVEGLPKERHPKSMYDINVLRERAKAGECVPSTDLIEAALGCATRDLTFRELKGLIYGCIRNKKDIPGDKFEVSLWNLVRDGFAGTNGITFWKL